MITINLCPQINMGFSQALWHRHANKVLSMLSSYAMFLCIRKKRRKAEKKRNLIFKVSADDSPIIISMLTNQTIFSSKCLFGLKHELN